MQSEEAKSDVMSRALCFYNLDTQHPGEIWALKHGGCKFIFYSSEGDRATVRDNPPPRRWLSAQETSHYLYHQWIVVLNPSQHPILP